MYGLYVKAGILANTLIDSDFQAFERYYHWFEKIYQ